MIDPELHTSDLEAVGFSWLSELAGRLLHRATDELQVLHRDGLVVTAVRTGIGGGVIADGAAGPGAPIADPVAFAAALRAATGVQVVTLIDARLLDDLAREIDAIATPGLGQVGLMAEAGRRWHAHPAVVTDPAPTAPRWPAVADALSTTPARSWAVLGAWRGDVLVASLLARWGDNGVDLLTSADHLQFRPRRSEAIALVERVERDAGPVVVALLADADDLEAIAAADDPWAALAAAVVEGRLLHDRGMEHVLEARPWAT